MAEELRSPQQAVYQWEISNDVPFKYRMLFTRLVDTTWLIVRDGPADNGAFIFVYRAWCLVLFVASVLTFYRLLLVIGFPVRWSMAGAVLYSLLPPLSLAFTHPVHTREDLLAYTLLNMGLVFLLKNKTIPFVLISILGALCRETLLILPFVYFFYGKDSLVTKFILTPLPVLTWIGLRIFMGHEKYDAVGTGLLYNLDNIFQTAVFMFMSFNVLWIPFLLGLFKKNTGREPDALNVMLRSSWPAATLVVTTTLVLGHVNEIRLLFLMAPWVFSTSLLVLKNSPETLREYLTGKTFLISTAVCTVVLAAIYVSVAKFASGIFPPLELHWWAALFVCLLATGAFIPFFARVGRSS